MQKTKIDWVDYVWNPVVGCKRGCSYCYGKRLNKRFKWLEKWEEPKFYPERLKQPYKLKKPSTIFVCSMAELFGSWIPDEWIYKVIQVAINNSRHRFMFLTKNARRMRKFVFSDNAWVGLTIDKQAAVYTQFNYFPPYAKHKFISFEPLLGEIDIDDILEGIEFVIIGAQTNPTIKPAFKWVNSILAECEAREIPVCVKRNLQKLYPQNFKINSAQNEGREVMWRNLD